MTDLSANKRLKITSSDIRAGMSKRWSAPEWAIMWEVGEGTGAQSGRYADAVMMSLWPSRGLELHGVEIKISRSDWKREAADPTKAEAVAKYCDRWWIHTPLGVVADMSEMPPAWGLREFDGKSWRTVREAEKTQSVQVSRPFLAAMLRRADGTMKGLMEDAMKDARDAAYNVAEKMRLDIRSQIDDGVKRRTERLEKSAADVMMFNEAFGKDQAGSYSCNPKEWGNAARSLSECGTRGYGALVARLRKAADEIESLAALSGGGEK